MMLYEQVVSTLPNDPLGGLAELKLAIKFKIDNVASYYWTHEQDNWDLLTDFPNMAPPFPNFWMEYNMPLQIHAHGEWIDLRKRGARPNTKAGIWITAPRMHYGWLLIARMFFGHKHDKTPWGGMVGCRLGVAHDGSLAIDDQGKPICEVMAPRRYIEQVDGQFGEGEAVAGLSQHMKAAMLAVSFLHCKNVVIVKNEPKKPKKMRAKRGEASERVPTFHTLDIRPLRDILRKEGKDEETGLKRAVHICRGHFKDYRAGGGLFGKYKDVFWWDSQVRGGGEDKGGEPDKDYNIKLD